MNQEQTGLLGIKFQTPWLVLPFGEKHEEREGRVENINTIDLNKLVLASNERNEHNINWNHPRHFATYDFFTTNVKTGCPLEPVFDPFNKG